MEATNVGKKSKIWMILIPGTILCVLMVVAVAGFTALASGSGGTVLTQTLSKPLGDATAAKFDINSGTGSSTLNALSGAGNVVVRMPSGIAARIHATYGLGKLTINPQLIEIDDRTYQSPDYDYAANTVEITVESGAGNVSVITQ